MRDDDVAYDDVDGASGWVTGATNTLLTVIEGGLSADRYIRLEWRIDSRL